jgi:hypothetical protein
MSTGARTTSTGSAAPGTSTDRSERPRDPAGILLGRLTVLPALLAMAWLLVGLPLLLAGAFTPVLMLVLAIPLAAVLVTAGLRWTPGQMQGPLLLAPARPARRVRADDGGRAAQPAAAAEPAAGKTRPVTPWWAVAAIILVAVAFGIDQLYFHSQNIIVNRDPASYANFGYWLAQHGSLPIPQDRAAFGGTHGVLTFASFAFYGVGTHIVPQFMAGLPMVLAGFIWAGGLHTAVAANAVLGALGVLALGGLVARLAGPRWAILATLVLAFSLPQEFTSRQTYSEPLAQVLFLGGLCLVIDSLSAGSAGSAGPRLAGSRVMAALGGLALGLTLLVRIDGASDILPVIPYIGMLLLARRPQALPLLGGLVAGGLYGAVDGIVLSRPYLASNKSSVIPLAAIGALVVVVTAILVLVLWRRGLPELRGRWRTWLPAGAAVLAVVVLAGFIARPHFQTVYGPVTRASGNAMAIFQRADGLPVQPGRLYYEISLHWIFWYIGVPAVLLATLGAALLARRCLRGEAPAWVLPLMVFSWVIVTTLYRPAIVPDQPWASRRLVPAVLPGFILLAVWACAWLVGWVRRQDRLPAVTGAVLAGVLAVAMVVPAVITTFGLLHEDGGAATTTTAVESTKSGLALQRTYAGEIPAVDGMCAAIPADASVVFLGTRVANNIAQNVRGMCGVPVAILPGSQPSAAQRVIRGIRAAGRVPVLLAARKDQVSPYGRARQIMNLHTMEDSHTLISPPTTTWKFTFRVWMSEPSR